ncbi:MAG: cytochrome c family protein [Rhodobiaceae bacterium]|nr:cytochrome c family protein [Rhodobiaceae bacterium]MCC0053882.1 cytochrome c family protein [Rhodobiaceae bacterium]
MKKLVFAAAALFAATSLAHAEGDATKGEKVFKKCKACHEVGEGAKNKVGPELTGIVGRAIAGVEGYAYGDDIKAKGAELGAWTEELLFEYLASPKDFVGGKSKMTFALKKDDDRHDVIAYLKTFSQ